jgi:hypothetical protein
MLASIYCKTAAGRSEIESRTQGLSAIGRRLLILVDGKRKVGELAAASGIGDGVNEWLARLLAEGLIAQLDESASVEESVVAEALELPRSAPAATVAVPAHTEPAPEWAVEPAQAVTISPEAMALIKAVMSEATRDYLGLLGAPVQRQIDAAQDHAELSRCVTKWGVALRESRLGKPVAAAYLQQVRDLLG